MSRLTWFEIHAAEPARAMRFYGGLLGWTFETFPGDMDPPYWVIKVDGKTMAVAMMVNAQHFMYREDLFGDRRSASRLREAYVEGRHGNWDFRVGKQIIAWGRTDRLNPTDVLTPRDFTLLSPEIDEDRFGAVAAKAVYTFTPSTSLIGVWLPDFRPNVLGLPMRPGVRYTEDVPDSLRTWALKLDRSGGAVDWSVSYFDGFDLSADLSLATATGTSSTIALQHHRLRMIGGDAAVERPEILDVARAVLATRQGAPIVQGEVLTIERVAVPVRRQPQRRLIQRKHPPMAGHHLVSHPHEVTLGRHIREEPARARPIQPERRHRHRAPVPAHDLGSRTARTPDNVGHRHVAQALPVPPYPVLVSHLFSFSCSVGGLGGCPRRSGTLRHTIRRARRAARPAPDGRDPTGHPRRSALHGCSVRCRIAFAN